MSISHRVWCSAQSTESTGDGRVVAQPDSLYFVNVSMYDGQEEVFRMRVSSVTPIAFSPEAATLKGFGESHHSWPKDQAHEIARIVRRMMYLVGIK